jgi:hypothetical protein
MSQNSFENIIKIFGMSNQLLENDLDRVESRFAIDLGRGHSRTVDKDTSYYPQFDEQVRREAARMGEHYEIFYCLEKTIRSLIADTLEAEEGAAWWTTARVSEHLQKEVEKRQKREIDSGTTPRSTEPIDFTTFGELGELISANWDIFGSIFNSIKAVERVMGNLNTLRGPIAHCGSLAEDEVLRLQLSMRDWFRLME